MGLITKEVEMTWSGSNKKHYIEKGYIFTKNKDKFIVKVSDLSHCSQAEVQVECDLCGKIKTMIYETYYSINKNGMYYCNKCAKQLYGTKNTLKTKLQNSISVEEWCQKNMSEEKWNDILARWDYDKNGCNPNELCYQTNKGIWLKCLKNPEHGSEKKNINIYVNKGSASFDCKQCTYVYYRNPELLQFFTDIEDSKKYPSGSKHRIKAKCPKCGYIKEYQINNLSAYGFVCPQCSDGFSYPEKIATCLLQQLNLSYIAEYSPIWAEGRKYDFLFKYDNISYILEMDGLFHFIDNPMSGQTKEESHRIDVLKDKMAREHNIKPIRINCEKSNINHIKNNILDSDLAKVFNLSIIDWNECDKFAATSIFIEVCNMWENKFTAKQIGEFFNISYGTVYKYLNRGEENGLCKYKQPSKVICLNTGIIYNNAYQAGEYYNLSSGSIFYYLKGKTKYAGKLPDGTPLHWMYYEDWLKENSQEKLQTAI